MLIVLIVFNKKEKTTKKKHGCGSILIFDGRENVSNTRALADGIYDEQTWIAS